VADFPQGAVLLCTVKSCPKRKDHALGLRKLFNRYADDKPDGRRRGRQPIRPKDQRHITLNGARADAVRNLIRSLVEVGALDIAVV
jgi:hypothetical protein